jgi:N-acetylglucosamine repressor
MSIRRINLNDFVTLDNTATRQVNESIVLNLVRERQPISRVDISRITNLKESTISSIVKRLLNEGLVYEFALGESSGGRKPKMLRLNSQYSLAVGIDIGFLETTIGLGNLNGEFLQKSVFLTSRTPEEFLPQLCKELDSFLREKVPSGMKIEGIGVSMPGITDRDRGEIVFAAYLGWKHVPLGALLRERFAYPIFFDDNMNAVGMAEIWFSNHAALKTNHLISVLINEGIGTAIIFGGHLYQGSNWGAGQFGHIPLDPEGPPCNCGSRGCWEAFASDLATLNRYKNQLGERGEDLETPLTVSGLARLAKNGDEAAVCAIRETARYIGMGIVILVNGLNPELIIIDGQICDSWDLIEPIIWQILREKALALNLEDLQIRPSAMKENPSLMGAISLVLCQRFAAPKVV